MRKAFTKAGRAYHRTVWRQTVRVAWSSILVGVFLLASALLELFTGGDRWLVLEFVVLAVINSLLVGCELGRHYQMLDSYILTQARWREIQQKMRAKLIEDGMPPEDADQALWQMDLDAEQLNRGELP